MDGATASGDSLRWAAIDRLGAGGWREDHAFDELVALASHVCGTPIGLVTLVAQDRQILAGRVGVDAEALPVDGAFCPNTFGRSGLFVVEDAATDPQFCSNPFVTGDPHVGFYAGTRLCTEDGVPVGALCVIDTVPRRLTEQQATMLQMLGRQVERLFSLRMALGDASGTRDELAASQTRLQLVLDAITQGVVVHDPDGSIVQANPAAERALGLTVDQMRGRLPVDPRWRTIHRDGSPFPGEEHPASLTLRYGVMVQDVTMGVHQPSGERRWLVVNSMPLPVPNPAADERGAVATFSDVTELTDINDQLQTSLRELAEAAQERAALLSSVSHDIKAPLASIRMMTEILEDRADAITPVQRDELIHRVRVEARRTEGVLSDLVAANRVGSGLRRPRRQRVDVDQLVRTITRDFVHEDHDVRLGRIEGDLLLWADRAQVERILDNLVSNAVRHTPTGSSVVVHAIDRGHDVDLVVEDDGPGIEDEMKDAIFRPYVRGHRSEGRPGSGLGLYLVQQFAQFHGGGARCEDVESGGARFVVTIPHGTPPEEPAIQTEYPGLTDLPA